MVGSIVIISPPPLPRVPRIWMYDRRKKWVTEESFLEVKIKRLKSPETVQREWVWTLGDIWCGFVRLFPCSGNRGTRKRGGFLKLH